MSRRSSWLAICALGACMPEYDPILICHNGNCGGTGRYADDSMEALDESLALERDGRPMIDGVELDTFLYYQARTETNTCLFAHDAGDPDAAPSPMAAAARISQHLQQDISSWNGERFYLKIELKPTVFGQADFHDEEQLGIHAECALDMALAAVENTRTPVTVLFDSVAECLHRSLYKRRTDARWAGLFDSPLVEVMYSGPVVPERSCVRFVPDVRTFFVRSWRDTEIETIRPVMVWLDRRSENTETLKIIRHLRPEYVATSTAPFVRGWIEGYK